MSWSIRKPPFCYISWPCLSTRYHIFVYSRIWILIFSISRNVDAHQFPIGYLTKRSQSYFLSKLLVGLLMSVANEVLLFSRNSKILELFFFSDIWIEFWVSIDWSIEFFEFINWLVKGYLSIVHQRKWNTLIASFYFMYVILLLAQSFSKA